MFEEPPLNVELESIRITSIYGDRDIFKESPESVRIVVKEYNREIELNISLFRFEPLKNLEEFQRKK